MINPNLQMKYLVFNFTKKTDAFYCVGVI